MSSTTIGGSRSTRARTWVHLGQSDLDDADIGAIRKAGLRARRLHSRRRGIEACAGARARLRRARARSIRRSSRRWPSRRRASPASASGSAASAPIPLVAIGGLNVERAKAVPRRGRGHRLGRHRHHAERRPGGPRERMDRRNATRHDGPHPDRADDRRLGLRRRRRDPGRPPDLRGARRLRRERDHGSDRAEHERRARDPSRAAGDCRRADRGGARRLFRRRDQDRDARERWDRASGGGETDIARTPAPPATREILLPQSRSRAGRLSTPYAAKVDARNAGG